jgi:hypothetical protein
MKIVSPVLLGLSLAVVGSWFAAAQETQSPQTQNPQMQNQQMQSMQMHSMQMQGPPKVLQITREFIKPGKSGAIHDKSESNFVQAMAKAKWPTHYVAMNSLSGKSRALYITGYSSFDAWEKDNAAIDKNKALSAELDKDSVTDGELLDGLDQVVLYYDDDLSYRPEPSLAHVRFMEITVVKIKAGHRKDFSDAVKMVIDANKKGGTSAQWAVFELAYGGGVEYVFFSADKSMAEIDTGYAEDKKFHDALGDDGMKKLTELEQACVDSSDSELFQINPRQSYPPEDWVKADPDFWTPKPAMAPAEKPAVKPLPVAKMPPR